MTETKNEIRVARNHKDRLFRMIFREKKELLSLYNAVNGTFYTNAEDLEIVTLENAIYMNMKNDLAFIMDSYLNLYEHQSTYSPNMPLRDLFYIAKELQGQIDHRDLYRNTLIKIPTPRFLVFYNGSEEQAEKKYLRLSEIDGRPGFRIGSNHAKYQPRKESKAIKSVQDLERICHLCRKSTNLCKKFEECRRSSRLCSDRMH